MTFINPLTSPGFISTIKKNNPLNYKTISISAEEEAVTSVFRRYNFYYPVEFSVHDAPPLKGFTWIKPSSFLRSMSKTNDLTHLLGGHTLDESRDLLTSFWAKFRAICPKHQLWAAVDSKKKPLTSCIPIFLHGDEGVTYKKQGLLVLSFQGAIGFGSSKRAKDMEANYRAMGEGIPMNFLKTGFQTRMLIAVCPKERVEIYRGSGWILVHAFLHSILQVSMVSSVCFFTVCISPSTPNKHNINLLTLQALLLAPVQEMYAEDRRVWNCIFEIAVKDLASCERDGVDVGESNGKSQKIYPIVLGNKGDWSYLDFQLNLRCSNCCFFSRGCLNDEGCVVVCVYVCSVRLPFFQQHQVSSANLERSYRRAPKGAKDADTGVEGAGICHLCTCGQGVDWENLNLYLLIQHIVEPNETLFETLQPPELKLYTCMYFTDLNWSFFVRRYCMYIYVDRAAVLYMFMDLLSLKTAKECSGKSHGRFPQNSAGSAVAEGGPNDSRVVTRRSCQW